MIQKKMKSFLTTTKNVTITKWVHAFKGYASTYNVGISNSFNPKLQLKSTEFAVENKLKKLLTE